MKKSFLKNAGIIVMAAAICLSPCMYTLASVVYNGPIATFTKQYVDSNEWTYVCYAQSPRKSTELSISISKIYKADGTTSNYKRIKVNPAIRNVLQGSRTLFVGSTTYYTIPSAYRAAGEKYIFFAMGNDPALDCQISGSFIAQQY